ncbi:MAG: Mth938-like domain-containing protein [Betaproteobacteria bacterium]
MKLHLSTGAGNVFTAYGPGYVEINRERFEDNLVVTPERILTQWAQAGFDGLVREDLAALLEWTPEIILLGTGDKIRFLQPRLSQDLTAARVGVDVMDVKAACRTFNVLAAEGRRVAAALILR